MTATSVYGIAIGDHFKDEDGIVYTVLSFITPPSMNAKWYANVKSSEDGDEIYPIAVEELQKMEKL